MYINRLIDSYLIEWKNDIGKKPLLLRGARQVGKSRTVKNLALGFDHYVEINFEESPVLHTIFELDLNPNRIIENLSIFLGEVITPGKTLLFFDEIQACPKAIASLRFFYEKLPALHVIAAGSLLEFALAALPSFGVGRVRSMFVYPLSFDEFLGAIGENLLLEAKQKADVNTSLPEILHLKLLDLLKRFLVIGGMPESVNKYVKTQNLLESQLVLDDLYLALKADFTKYKNTVPPTRLGEILESVVKQTGGKFTYTKASTLANHVQIKEALELLMMAGLVIPTTHTAANGIPLGAEIDAKKRKMMLLDTGIYQRILGLNLADFLFDSTQSVVNKGAIAEQFFGLELLKYSSPYQSQNLYYWHRESTNANAELDYVVQKGHEILPIEVKSSGKGSMQSLRQFLKEKNTPFGYRFALEQFAVYDQIKSFPLYAVSNFLRKH